MTLPLSGLGGSLIAHSYLLAGSAACDAAFARPFRAIARRNSQIATAPARARLDLVAAPLAVLLGFEVRQIGAAGHGVLTALLTAGGEAAAALATSPGLARREERRALVHDALGRGARWVLHLDDGWLRVLDASRPHARRWVGFEIARCAHDPELLGCLRRVAGHEAFVRNREGRTPLELMIAASDGSLRQARAALQQGVEAAAVTLTAALARRRRRAEPLDPLFQEALTVVYRILFLMFAESRGLVPVWHPTYRDSYTIEALRDAIERGRDARGTWDALQAIARLAHRGARAGDLLVTPFNGRLFSPAHSPAVARSRVPDADAAAVVSALTLSSAAGTPAARIPFTDLGVEQLGAVYERVLDFEPAVDATPPGRVTLRRALTRKTTGSFYTPRSITEFIVRRALHPLVHDASPEGILSLRVLDPAMGSGAFLVAACRYLARAYEAALVRAGHAGAEDFTTADRAGFRRLVAQQCLFGVDINPTAVQLGRLSLWLCALAADKPLSFLDHRLRVGNSLVGASLEDAIARAPGRRRPATEPTLFGDEALDAIGHAVTVWRALARQPDDTLDDVRRKERLFSDLASPLDPIAAWRRILDLWCAIWFWPEGEEPPDAREYAALVSVSRGDASFLHRSAHRRLATAQHVAAEARFFHWTLEFPEAFYSDEGRPHPRPGFDAIVGNPPWEMLRAEDAASRPRHARETRRLLRFTRDAGVYRLQSDGHANAYQIFLERSLQLLRPDGRLGLVLPWGGAGDDGSAALRRFLFDRCRIDEVQAMDNREGIFPIHRAVRFLILHATKGPRTEALRCRFGVRDAQVLDRLPDDGEDPSEGVTPTELTRDLIERVSGPGLAIPYLGAPAEVRILEALVSSAPPAASPAGWGVRFGRELNATEDRGLLRQGGDGLPVIGGRHVTPFAVDAISTAWRIEAEVARARLGEAAGRTRLAYRDVAGAGNRMTLIAALVPAGVVTTHTLFCLKTRLGLDEQLFLCAVLNSYVANFVVRSRVGTHVTTALVGSVPIPRPPGDSVSYRHIVALARRLLHTPADLDGAARLQAAVAGLYAIEATMFAGILDTFPLVPQAERRGALTAFEEGRWPGT
jgi:hypothetical protein